MAGSKKVGLIGEDPSDKAAIRNLLSKKYDYDFISLLKHQTGDNLETDKTQRLLKVELKTKQPDLLIFIRDLDSFQSDEAQVAKRHKWFNKLKTNFGGKSLLLLNIYELEALILADIAAFNRLFKTNIIYKADPMAQKEPKEFLARRTEKSRRKFRESDNAEVFQELDFEEVKRRCRYFRDFIRDFDKALAS